MKRLAIFLLALCIIISGCIGGQSKSPKSTAPTVQQATQPNSEAAPDVSLDDADVPFISENETVEIGEMI